MFTEQNIDKEFTLKQKWQKIIDFLYKELRRKEEILMDERSKLGKNEEKAEENKRKAFNIANEPSLTVAKCVLCSETDHVINVTKKGKSVVTYFACLRFVEMQPRGRLNELKNKGLCFQCLNPGLKIGHNGFCFNKFNCPHSSHKKFDIGYQVLFCDSHKGDPKNQELLEEYKAKHNKS